MLTEAFSKRHSLMESGVIERFILPYMRGIVQCSPQMQFADARYKMKNLVIDFIKLQRLAVNPRC